MGLPIDPATGAIVVKTVGGGGGGAGTEYTEGDVDATITGTAILFEDAGDTLRVPSAANRLPVSLPAGGSGLTDTELRASAVPVTVANFPATQPVSLATGIDVIDRAARLLGHVTVDNASIAVTGTFWQATQPVSGPLTDAQLRAAAVPVSMATQTPDVTDRDARLLGRAKILDSAGTVIDPALKGQLPAALVGGRLSVDASGVAVPVTGTFWQATQPVSGTVTANAGTGPFPVSDNAGSLTVDAPVGTPLFARLSDGAAALVGQKTMANSLPVALASDQSAVPVSGTFWQATQPVSLATNTPDVTDRAAREVGRVRIWDGTDEATIVPVRTQLATTEKGLIVYDTPNRLATYSVVTAEVAPAITIGVKELLALWYTGGTKDIYIVEIVLSVLVTTASTTGGRTNVEVFKITAAPTGGTALTAADIGGGGASAITNAMQVKTGGGTLGTAVMRQGVEHATQPLGTQRFQLFSASTVGNGIILRGGASDGINIQVNRVVAHTALVDQWTAQVRWVEL